MKIALLCCGPSLTQFLPEYTVPGYDLVVGVNTAAWLYPVDWCRVHGLLAPARQATLQ